MADYTSERVSPEEYERTTEDRLIYLLHEKTYRFAAEYVAGKSVLDFGCGDGYGTRILAERSRNIVGVDVDSPTIELAKKKHSSASLTFACQPPEAAQLPFDAGSFDVAVSFQVIEHVDDVALYLKEIHRVLRNGGRFLLSTPNASSRLLPFQNPWNKHHLREYSLRELTAVLGAHFHVEQALGLTYTPPWLDIETRRVTRNKWLLLPLSNKLVPQPLRRRLLQRAWDVAHARRPTEPPRTDAQPDLDDVVITAQNVVASASLLIVCQKPN
jgi:2-polyprenyl-3-methyl-5-hydroxy-6-metoxy-1,4-benzoquinol methylase